MKKERNRLFRISAIYRYIYFLNCFYSNKHLSGRFWINEFLVLGFWLSTNERGWGAFSLSLGVVCKCTNVGAVVSPPPQWWTCVLLSRAGHLVGLFCVGRFFPRFADVQCTHCSLAFVVHWALIWHDLFIPASYVPRPSHPDFKFVSSTNPKQTQHGISVLQLWSWQQFVAMLKFVDVCSSLVHWLNFNSFSSWQVSHTCCNV